MLVITVTGAHDPVTGHAPSALGVTVACGIRNRPMDKGFQLKILLYTFKLAQLASFENKNSFQLSIQKRG